MSSQSGGTESDDDQELLDIIDHDRAADTGWYGHYIDRIREAERAGNTKFGKAPAEGTHAGDILNMIAASAAAAPSDGPNIVTRVMVIGVLPEVFSTPQSTGTRQAQFKDGLREILQQKIRVIKKNNDVTVTVVIYTPDTTGRPPVHTHKYQLIACAPKRGGKGKFQELWTHILRSSTEGTIWSGKEQLKGIVNEFPAVHQGSESDDDDSDQQSSDDSDDDKRDPKRRRISKRRTLPEASKGGKQTPSKEALRKDTHTGSESEDDEDANKPSDDDDDGNGQSSSDDGDDRQQPAPGAGGGE